MRLCSGIFVAAICALGGCDRDPCSGQPAACVSLTIESAIASVDQMVVSIDMPHAESLTTPATAERLSFPSHMGIVIPATTVQLQISIEAANTGEVVGVGSVNVTIPPTGFVTATCTLSGLDGLDGGVDLSGADLILGDGPITVPSDLAGPDLAPIPDLEPPIFEISTPFTGIGNLVGLVAADFDKNNYPDIAWADATGTTSNTVGVAFNSAGAFTGPRLSLDTPATLTSVVAVDADNDGKPDVVGISSGGGQVFLTAGSTSQGFTSYGSFGASAQIVAAVGGDFNGDGKGDVAVSTVSGSPSAQVITNPTNVGTFESSFALPANPGAVATGDIDGDTLPDLIFVLPNDPSLKILFHTSSNMIDSLFSSGSQYALPSTPAGGVAVADLNGDNDPDVLVSVTGALYAYAGSHTYNLASPVSSTAPNRSNTIAVADFDGDGALDAAITDESNDRVVILRNTGSLSFSQWHTIPLGTSPTIVVAADFDGDGKPDLATANAASGSISIILNRTH